MQKSKNTLLLLALLSVSASPLVAMNANQQLALAGAAGALGLRVFQAAIADETVTVVPDQYAGYVQRNVSRLKTNQRDLAVIITAILEADKIKADDLSPRSKAVFAESAITLNAMPADIKDAKENALLPLRDLVQKLTTPVAPVTKVENKIVLSQEDAQALTAQLVAQLSKPAEEKKGLPTAAEAVTLLTDLSTSALGQDAAVDAAFNTLALAKGYAKLAPAAPQDETKAEAKA